LQLEFRLAEATGTPMGLTNAEHDSTSQHLERANSVNRAHQTPQTQVAIYNKAL
ncbi:hypothetical protein AVEN_162152-2-1, partial [Araneus ventricosus]